MITVRSPGRPKCSIGLAALRAIAMKSFLRHVAMPGAAVGVIVIRDTKYEACSRSRLRSSSPCLRHSGERLRDVDLVVVAAADRHVEHQEAAAAEVLDDEPLAGLDVRNADRVDRDDHDPLMQRMGVLDLGAQRERRRVLARVEEHGDARDAHERRLYLAEAVEELLERALLLAAGLR